MDIAAFVRQLLLTNGVIVDRAVSRSSILRLADRLVSLYRPVELIRIGGPGDGGYLIPDDLNGVRRCFSPGVDVKSGFEAELAKRFGIHCFMADASVSGPAVQNDLFEFDQKFLGMEDEDNFISLRTWVDDKVHDDDQEMILQMDIEGFEYPVLITASMECLNRFRILVIEFHFLHKVFDRVFLDTFDAILKRLSTSFSIVHMHPNNCCGMFRRGDISIPSAMEMTLLRNDRFQYIPSADSAVLPHVLDTPNISGVHDFVLPELWWKKNR